MKTNLQKTVATLGVLTVPELRKLREIINDLLEVTESQAGSDDQEASPARSGAAGHIAAGHIELKTIRGYGPYKYLRVWKGKSLTSTYLGKASS